MGISLLLTELSASSTAVQAQAIISPLRGIRAVPLVELSSICINLTLLLVFLFIVSARQIFTCVGRFRVAKDDYSANPVPIHRVADGDTRSIEIGTGFKISVLCSFYLLLLQVLVLGFDGAGLIRESAHGTVPNWAHICLPAAQALAWFVLSFSVLHCKFKVTEKFPLLLRL